MTAPVQLVLAFLALLVAARTRVTGVVLGQSVSVPVLGVVGLAVALALVVVVLVLLRLLVRDGLCLRPRAVTP
jgi:hypothetical protein